MGNADEVVAPQSCEQLEEALQICQARFEAALQSAGHILYRLNAKRGGYDYISTYVAELTGHPYELFSQLTLPQLAEYFHPDDRDRIFGEHGEIAQACKAKSGNKTTLRVEYRLRKADGSYCWLRDQNTIYFGLDDQIECFVGSAYDITENKRYEEVLRTSAMELDRFFSNSLDLLCIADTEGYFRRLNPEWEKNLGYSVSELEGHSFLDLVHPDDLAGTVSAVRDLASAKEVLNFVNRYRHKDGTYRWIEWRAFPSGTLIHAAARDITERVLAEQALREREASFSNLFETMVQGVVYQDAAGKIISANPAAERILGISLDQMMGVTSLDPRWRTIREDGTEFPGNEHPSMVALRTGKEVGNVLMGIYHPQEDRHRWAIVDAVPEFRNGDTSPWRVFATITDITERRLAETELRASETRFHNLFDSMDEGFAFHEVICNEEGQVTDYRYLNINAAFERLTGLRRETTIGRTVREVIPGIEESWIEDYGRVAQTGEPIELENYVQELDRYYRVKAYSPERGKFAVVFDEITEQRKLIRNLEERESELRVLFESSQAGIIMVDPTGTITMANRRMAEMFGYSQEELIGTSYPSLVNPDQQTTGDERMRLLIKGEIDHVATERHYLRKDGSDFWGYLSGRRHEDSDGRLISLVGHITDISELKQTQAAIRESEERFRSIMALSPDIISIISKEGELVYNSPAALNIHGYTQDEMVGQNTFELIHPDDQVQVGSAFREVLNNPSATITIQYRYRNKDGSYAWMECTANNQLANPHINGVIAISRDITDRKKMEDDRLDFQRQLLHAQKLESLGVLAGGIAHDFNNILLAIIGNADLALMRMNPESPAIENLHRIEQAAARAADLAKQMLAYSGKGKFVVEHLDLNRLLEEMLHMLEVSISKKAVLRLNLTPSLPSVEADATQLRQIIMNLVINASEAIGDKSGVIAITTGCMDCDQSYLKDVWLDENLTPGLFVYLEIADTGCGMDRDTMARIFDPFFTTKFTGRGLGMAAVLGIVRGHKGAIKVYSEAGKGSSFKVLLPASGRPEALFNGATAHDDWHGSGTVLLVDDEETVRGIGKEMLQELGFQTLTANDGREALALFREHPEIVFVILDLTMPHMDGEQCFRELRQLRPDVKVIMSSGYNEYEVTQKFMGKGLAGFIQKPYKLSVLKEAIRGTVLK
jgi:PAS domain S-box-containing protein